MLIVIEGCIGAGKTTVANGLAAYRASKVLLERFQENPFLQAFYDDPLRDAIETEFAFLLLHFHQLKEASSDIAKRELVADFHLGKDLIYATTNLLDSKPLSIFRELHDDLAARLPKPSLMICLSATTDLLLERIQQRKRNFELKVDPDYYSRINVAYETFFKNYCGRKLRVSMDESDFVQNPGLYETLSALVDSELPKL